MTKRYNTSPMQARIEELHDKVKSGTPLTRAEAAEVMMLIQQITAMFQPIMEAFAVLSQQVGDTYESFYKLLPPTHKATIGATTKSIRDSMVRSPGSGVDRYFTSAPRPNARPVKVNRA